MLDDMSTDCFINGLRCLLAIRGAVQKIFCDQGTNFVGADNEMKITLQEKLQDTVEECEFVFNPPHAPHCDVIVVSSSNRFGKKTKLKYRQIDRSISVL